MALLLAPRSATASLTAGASASAERGGPWSLTLLRCLPGAAEPGAAQPPLPTLTLTVGVRPVVAEVADDDAV
jgi:hypothetical protein